MKSGLRDRNNQAVAYLTRQIRPNVSMKSGLGDRNNLPITKEGALVGWMSQWSPVLETGTIPQHRRGRTTAVVPVSMKSGRGDRNNAEHEFPVSGEIVPSQ